MSESHNIGAAGTGGGDGSGSGVERNATHSQLSALMPEEEDELDEEEDPDYEDEPDEDDEDEDDGDFFDAADIIEEEDEGLWMHLIPQSSPFVSQG